LENEAITLWAILAFSSNKMGCNLAFFIIYLLGPSPLVSYKFCQLNYQVNYEHGWLPKKVWREVQNYLFNSENKK
jgi:hypothetical protein